MKIVLQGYITISFSTTEVQGIEPYSREEIINEARKEAYAYLKEKENYLELVSAEIDTIAKVKFKIVKE